MNGRLSLLHSLSARSLCVALALLLSGCHSLYLTQQSHVAATKVPLDQVDRWAVPAVRSSDGQQVLARLDRVRLDSARTDGERVRVRTRPSLDLVLLGVISMVAGGGMVVGATTLNTKGIDTADGLIFGWALAGTGVSFGIMGLALSGAGLSRKATELDADEVEPATAQEPGLLRLRRHAGTRSAGADPAR